MELEKGGGTEIRCPTSKTCMRARVYVCACVFLPLVPREVDGLHVPHPLEDQEQEEEDHQVDVDGG